MLDKPSWTMSGILADKRELKTKKGDEVWAYSLKLTALGGMYSMQTKNKELFEKCVEGEIVNVTGSFEQYNGSVQLVLEQITSVQDNTAPRSKAS